MVVSKKSDKTSPIKKTKSTKVVSSKEKEVKTPKAITLEVKTPKHNIEESTGCCERVNAEKRCCKKGGMRIFMILLLLANLVVGILALCKIVKLQEWIVMGSGGEDNLKTLERLYDSDQYQEYFRGEIENLQTKVKILNPSDD